MPCSTKQAIGTQARGATGRASVSESNGGGGTFATSMASKRAPHDVTVTEAAVLAPYAPGAPQKRRVLEAAGTPMHVVSSSEVYRRRAGPACCQGVELTRETVPGNATRHHGDVQAAPSRS